VVSPFINLDRLTRSHRIQVILNGRSINNHRRSGRLINHLISRLISRRGIVSRVDLTISGVIIHHPINRSTTILSIINRNFMHRQLLQ